jgi:hypothetical protein
MSEVFDDDGTPRSPPPLPPDVAHLERRRQAAGEKLPLTSPSPETAARAGR